MSNVESVPFLDLVSNNMQFLDEYTRVFRDTVSRGRFIGGPQVEKFEEEFSRFCEAEYCIGVGSGTDALRFSLIAGNIQQGDIVITVPNTFIATTEAVTQSGGRPVFIDVDDKTNNIDITRLGQYLSDECFFNEKTGTAVEKKSGSPVKAIIPVHLYGQMSDMDSIVTLSEKYNLFILEDACQAHGAEYFSKVENRWKKSGSIGDASAFSFYPGKNLGALGEGGAVTTNNKVIADKIRMLRDHGQGKKYFHSIEGYNGRLDALQAGMLRIKLRNLAGWNESRRNNAVYYKHLFSDTNNLKVPYDPVWSKSVYHLFVIRVEEQRDTLQKYLSDEGVYTGLHYPVPLHLQNAYKYLGYNKGDFPVAEKLANEILSIPMYPELDKFQQEYVVGCVNRYFNTEEGTKKIFSEEIA